MPRSNTNFEIKSNSRIASKGKTIAVLHFDCSRAPYVIKCAGGQQVDREVPWREGNNTRTATREDLIRLLAPLASLPKLEIVSMTVLARKEPRAASKTRLEIDALLYATYAAGARITIPNRKCSCVIRAAGRGVEFGLQRLFTSGSAYVAGTGERPSYQPIIADHDQLVISGSGMLRVNNVYSAEDEECAFVTEHAKYPPQ